MAKSPQDRVKVFIATSDNGWSRTIITSREIAELTKEAIKNDCSSSHISITGRLNDADGNDIELCYKREEVSGIEIIDINNQF